MSRKGKFISIVAVLALVASLMAVFPASVAIGTHGTSVSADSINGFIGNNTDSAVDNDLVVTANDTGLEGNTSSGEAATATVTNETTSVSIALATTETADTGVFTFPAFTVIPVADDTDDNASPIGGDDGDVLRVDYTTSTSVTLSANITVDATGPTFTLTSPADGTISDSASVTFTTVIDDSASGFFLTTGALTDNMSAEFILDFDAAAPFTPSLSGSSVTAIQTVSSLSDVVHAYRFEARDAVGNLTRTGADFVTGTVSTTDGTSPTTVLEDLGATFETDGIQAGDAVRNLDDPGSATVAALDGTTPETKLTTGALGSAWNAGELYAIDHDFTVEVDTTIPALLTAGDPDDGLLAATGDIFDADTETIDTDSDVRNSIRVGFNDTLNAATVGPDDFRVTVDGVVQTIAAAKVFSAVPAHVFLTLDSDLAPDAGRLTATTDAPVQEIVVRMVGDVEDDAGNRAVVGEVNVLDGIGPGISIGVVATGSSRPIDDNQVIVTIDADEDLGSAPKVEAFALTGLGAACDGAGEGERTASKITDRKWTVTLTITGDCTYDIGVRAFDATDVNKVDSISLPAVFDRFADQFEIDSSIPDIDETVDIIPADGDDLVDFADPFFISVDWSAESTEYEGDSHSAITITSATLDDVAVELFTTDDIKFSLAVRGIALGEHTFSVTGEDAAGNERTETSTFTVIEPAPVSIVLKPGWNLISVPDQIADPSVGSVFTDPTVTKIFTWDPVRFWTASIRNPDTGELEGRLISITPQQGYWVFSDGFVTVDVQLVDRGPTTPLPQYQLSAGFNLIGYTSIVRPPAGATVAAYTGSLGDAWSSAIRFDPQDGFETAKPGGTFPGAEGFEVGRGYWIFLTEDATLVP